MIDEQKTVFYQLPSNERSKSSSIEIDGQKEEKKLKFLVKKRGRKNKSKGIKKPENKNEHNKFSNDNIKRKIKAFFNKILLYPIDISFVNLIFIFKNLI